MLKRECQEIIICSQLNLIWKNNEPLTTLLWPCLTLEGMVKHNYLIHLLYWINQLTHVQEKKQQNVSF